MKNKKGLSTIVTTLIIILIALVAVGIIATVLRNLTGDTQDDVKKSTNCMSIEFSVQKADTNATSDTSLTLKRSSRGPDEGVGVKVMFYTEEGNSGVEDFADTSGIITFEPIETKTTTFDLSDWAGDKIESVEITPFYYNENGEEVLCTTQPAHEV